LPYDETEVRRAAHVATKRRQAAAVQIGKLPVKEGGHADSGQWFDSRNDGGDFGAAARAVGGVEESGCGVTALFVAVHIDASG